MQRTNNIFPSTLNVKLSIGAEYLAKAPALTSTENPNPTKHLNYLPKNEISLAPQGKVCTEVGTDRRRRANSPRRIRVPGSLRKSLGLRSGGCERRGCQPFAGRPHVRRSQATRVATRFGGLILATENWDCRCRGRSRCFRASTGAAIR